MYSSRKASYITFWADLSNDQYKTVVINLEIAAIDKGLSHSSQFDAEIRVP